MRSTAEALRAISDELRALEIAASLSPTPRTPAWAFAVTSFAAGVTLALALRAAGILERRP